MYTSLTPNQLPDTRLVTNTLIARTLLRILLPRVEREGGARKEPEGAGLSIGGNVELPLWFCCAGDVGEPVPTNIKEYSMYKFLIAKKWISPCADI